MAEHRSPYRSPTVHRWSQRDQLTSFSFQRRRLIRSFIEANPESTERPDRRLWAGMAGSTLIAVLALAVMAVLGILKPGNSTAWRNGDSIIVEKETGTRFVLDKDKVLHPVVNYTSAVLFLGSRAKVAMTSRASLASAARGAPVGILGAPDALPAEKDLLSGPWTTCSEVALDGRSGAPVVTADLGTPPTGELIGGSDGLLVQSAGGDRHEYLVTNGLRYQVASPAVAPALGWEGVRPLPVAPSWISTVAAGPDLDVIGVQAAGSPGPVVSGRPALVGTVYEVASTAGLSTFWLVLTDGLVEVSPTVAALVTADGTNRANVGGRATPLPVADLAQAPRSEQSGPGSALPARPPVLVPTLDANQESVCITVTSTTERARAEVRIRSTVPRATAPRGKSGAGQGADAPADVVQVTPGRGALVTAAGSEGLGAVYLVTDLGILYPLASADVATVLGYGAAQPTQIPAAVIRLLPVGPVLGAGPTAGAAPPSAGVEQINSELGG